MLNTRSTKQKQLCTEDASVRQIYVYEAFVWNGFENNNEFAIFVSERNKRNIVCVAL